MIGRSHCCLISYGTAKSMSLLSFPQTSKPKATNNSEMVASLQLYSLIETSLVRRRCNEVHLDCACLLIVVGGRVVTDLLP